MSFTPTTGKLGKVAFTPSGGTLLTVNNTGWTAKEENRTAEVTNQASAGVAQRIPGVDDSSGSFDVVLDTTAMPRTGSLYAGNSGLLEQYYNGTLKKSQSVIIKSVTFKSVVRGGQATEYTVEWEGNGAVTES
jgi:hypothetical protein